MQFSIRYFVALLAIAPLFTQSFTGAVVGTVSDPSGAAITGAKVIAVEQRSNVTAEAMASADGGYAFPALRSGMYRITVEAPGFRRYVRSGIEVRVNDRLRLDLELQLGAVNESIEVTGAAPLVESETGALGTVIDNRKIVSLPLNTRNPFQLALLSPGVVPSPNFGNAFNSSANFIINGNRGNTSEMMIDGITNSVPAANPILVVSIFPSPDALEEFKVHTNGYAAEYGRSGGGIINMVIKSGSNQFRGVVYEFLRNSKIDANDYFANRNGRPIGAFRRNQFGGSFGGPIWRDKAFFFVNFEALRERSRNQISGTVPSTAQRRGDFSQPAAPGSNCGVAALFDPDSTQFVNAFPTRQPFVGNLIPASRQDKAGQGLVSFFPNPTTTGASCSGINNFFSDKTAALNTNQMDMKFDWVPSAKNKFTAGLAWRSRAELPPNHYGNQADTRNVFGDNIPSKSMRLEYNRTQTPTLLLQGRFGITRLERVFGPNTAESFSLAELGFPAALERTMIRPLGFPVVSAAGYLGMGKGAFLDQSGTAFTWAASVTKIAGKHNWKTGMEYRVQQSSEGVGTDTSGNYAFDATFTRGPNANQTAGGNSIAGMLIGVPTTGQVGYLPKVLTSNPYFGIYVQDDWKVTRKLTLNVGIRWDVEKGRTERFRQLSYFDFDAPLPIAAQTGIPNLRGGLRFVGVDGNPNRQFDTDPNNIAPRFGFAYSLTPKTIIRGGYGIFYLPYIGAASGWASGINGFLSFTPMLNSIDGLRPSDRLSNPFPSGIDLPAAPGSGLLTNIGQDFGASGRDGAVDRGARVGYSQQWNFNIQRELPSAVTVEVAYVGNKGTKLTDGPLGHQLNQLTASQMALGTQLQQSVANPFAPFVKTGPLSRPATTRGQLLRPYPHFLGLYNFRPASGASIYHAMTARVEKRFAAGLTLLASFTGGKLIEDTSQTVGFLGPAPTHQDVYNRRDSRSLASQDVKQRLVVSYVYDIPFGRGKSFAANMPRWADNVAGGWQVNGILTYSAGAPLAITNQQNNSGSFSAVQRPNVTGDPNFSSDRTSQDQLAQWFDTSRFSQPAPFTFGNSPRIVPSLRRDATRQWDFSLFKNFSLTETKRFELRGEFFNLTNTPIFDAPGQVFGNPQFGVVNAQINTPRQVQAGLKFYF